MLSSSFGRDKFCELLPVALGPGLRAEESRKFAVVSSLLLVLVTYLLSSRLPTTSSLPTIECCIIILSGLGIEPDEAFGKYQSEL